MFCAYDLVNATADVLDYSLLCRDIVLHDEVSLPMVVVYFTHSTLGNMMTHFFTYYAYEIDTKYDRKQFNIETSQLKWPLNITYNHIHL